MLTPAAGLGAVTAARASVTAVAAAYGLVIGSFLNVVAYRTPRGLSVIRPRSFCPACSNPIRAGDNVPVASWVLLHGRCRTCGQPISARYPVVELGTGVLFGAVAWGLGPHWAVPGMCILAATALALAVIEVDGQRSPPGLALVGTGGGVVLLAAAAAADGRWWHLGGMLIGAATGAALAGALTLGSSRGDGGPGHGARRADGAGPIDSPWAVIPAAAAVGWVGWTGVAVGVPVGVVVLGALVVARRATSGRSAAGIALAAAAGGAAAVIAGLATGKPLGL